MKPDLFIAELLFMLITCVSLFLVYQFAISKNGWLRKLMIFHWSCQAWTTLWSGAWFWMQNEGTEPVPLGVGRIMALLPLTVSMILFLIYIVKQNNKKIKNHRL